MSKKTGRNSICVIDLECILEKFLDAVKQLPRYVGIAKNITESLKKRELKNFSFYFSNFRPSSLMKDITYKTTLAARGGFAVADVVADGFVGVIRAGSTGAKALVRDSHQKKQSIKIFDGR